MLYYFWFSLLLIIRHLEEYFPNNHCKRPPEFEPRWILRAYHPKFDNMHFPLFNYVLLDSWNLLKMNFTSSPCKFWFIWSACKDCEASTFNNEKIHRNAWNVELSYSFAVLSFSLMLTRLGKPTASREWYPFPTKNIWEGLMITVYFNSR